MRRTRTPNGSITVPDPADAGDGPRSRLPLVGGLPLIEHLDDRCSIHKMVGVLIIEKIDQATRLHLRAQILSDLLKLGIGLELDRARGQTNHNRHFGSFLRLSRRAS